MTDVQPDPEKRDEFDESSPEELASDGDAVIEGLEEPPNES